MDDDDDDDYDDDADDVDDDGDDYEACNWEIITGETSKDF